MQRLYRKLPALQSDTDEELHRKSGCRDRFCGLTTQILQQPRASSLPFGALHGRSGSRCASPLPTPFRMEPGSVIDAAGVDRLAPSSFRFAGRISCRYRRETGSGVATAVCLASMANGRLWYGCCSLNHRGLFQLADGTGYAAANVQRVYAGNSSLKM